MQPDSSVRGCRWRIVRTTLWVPETLHMSCDVLIFVEEAADAVASVDLAARSARGGGVVVREQPGP